jgi:hypothetical protein
MTQPQSAEFCFKIRNALFGLRAVALRQSQLALRQRKRQRLPPFWIKLPRPIKQLTPTRRRVGGFSPVTARDMDQRQEGQRRHVPRRLSFVRII